MRTKTVFADTTALWYIRKARMAGQPLVEAEPPRVEDVAVGPRNLDRLGLSHIATSFNRPAIAVPAGLSATSSDRVRAQRWDFDALHGAVRQRASRRQDGCKHTQAPLYTLYMETGYSDVLFLGPAACLLTLARHWPVSWLAMLADELCGRFSLDPDGSAFTKVDPLVTIGELQEMAHIFKGRYGAKRLRLALDLAGDNAESPFEAQIRTWTCGSLSLGGCGCGKPFPISNPVINLGSGYGHGYGNVSCRIDLFWPSARLGVECDGVQHEGREQRDKDARRDIRLANKGISELRITSKAFDSFNAASEFGQALRRRLGLACPFDEREDRVLSDEEELAWSSYRDRSMSYWSSISMSPWNHVPAAGAASVAIAGDGALQEAGNWCVG